MQGVTNAENIYEVSYFSNHMCGGYYAAFKLDYADPKCTVANDRTL